MLMKLKCKTYLSDIPLKCWETFWKFQNRKIQQQKNIAWSILYIINNLFQVYVFTNYWNIIFTFLISFLVAWEVSFSKSFSFEHEGVNWLQWFCCFNSIKNSFFSKVFKNVQIKQKMPSSFTLRFRRKWKPIKHVLKKLFFRLVPL